MERFPSALSLFLLHTKPVQGSGYANWLGYHCHTCRERIASEGCPCRPKTSSEYVLFSFMQWNTHTWFVLNECLMLKESTVLVGIFITTPFGKTPFLSLLFASCNAYCLLSSFQCGLRWGLMLCWWCVCCCAWLFGFKTVSCPFQESNSTETCWCSVYGFSVFGPRFFWRVSYFSVRFQSICLVILVYLPLLCRLGFCSNYG